MEESKVRQQIERLTSEFRSDAEFILNKLNQLVGVFLTRVSYVEWGEDVERKKVFIPPAAPVMRDPCGKCARVPEQAPTHKKEGSPASGWVSCKDACRHYGISRSTIHRQINRKEIKAKRVKNRWLVFISNKKVSK